MAIIEKKYEIDLQHVGKKNLLTNHGILVLLESIACFHSDMVGYGIKDIEKNFFTWVLLHWKIHVLKRVTYNSKVIVKTWASFSSRVSTLRDFEIYDENNNLICIASSKWALINLKNNCISKITPEVLGLYQPEEKSVFNENDIPKLKLFTPCTLPNYTFKVQRRDIDVNNHMHNVYYLDYAYETLPQNIYELDEPNNFEIMYKTGAKLGDEIVCYYLEENNSKFVVLKNAITEQLNAIVKLF